jgi:4-amino-4-deoxy-L-arabinose transferase-like glycosyltransferase
MAEPLDRTIPSLVVVEGRDSSLPRLAGNVLTWERLVLTGILLLSAVLDFFRLNQEGYANTYYAAAVKSMLASWHNFFFVSFDPGGFLAVDKSPLGLWVQAASAKLFGFSGMSLLLPQALAGVLSAALLYHLVSRVFGSPAGLLAALGLALTPIAVVDNRNNTADSLLILTLLLAAWAVTKAAESGRLRWLLLGAALVGLGFNIKELQAYLVLPALFLAYLAAAQVRLRTRLWHLLVAGGVLLIVSFSWIVAVDLTPASQRPYVSDSGTNSELSLALGYNGFGRLTAGLLSHLPIPFLHVKLDFSIVPGISTEIGNPGLLRLFSPSIAEQVSWLLPVALIGLIAALVQPRRYRDQAGADTAHRGYRGMPVQTPSREGTHKGLPLRLRREYLALVLWGAWLVTAGVFFSVARFYHLYYLIMLAPAVTALAGIGVVALWNDCRASLTNLHGAWWRGWLLPLTLLGTALIQAHVLAAYASASGWPTWLAPFIAGTCILAAAALVAIRVGLRFLITPNLLVRPGVGAALILAVAGTLSLFVAPAAWAAVSVLDGNGGAWLPQPGPSQGFGGGLGSGRPASGGQPGGGIPGGHPTGVAGRSFTPPTNGFSRGTTRGGTGGGGPSGGGFGGAGGAITFAGSQVPTLDPKLLHYLEAHKGKARYLVATTTSTYASLFILETGQPVMTLGGYQGWDRILTPAQLSRLASKGIIRFFLLPASSTSTGATGPSRFGGTAGNSGVPSVDANLSSVNNDLLTWIRKHAILVSSSEYSSSSSSVGSSATNGLQLYEYTG